MKGRGATGTRAAGRQAARIAALLGALSCSGAGAPSAESLYLTSAPARRVALVASLVNPDNGYSQLRLAHYDTGDAADWSLLPESNPRVDVIQPSELDAPSGVSVGGPVTAAAAALAPSDAAMALDHDALVAFGESAFFRYPMQVSLPAETATRSRAAFARYGFWSDATHGAGGLVRQETPDGASVLAFTCSTCHADVRDGVFVAGVGNASLDVGRLTVDASVGGDAKVVANFLAWGPGRVDVTTSAGTEPVRIADTRPVAWLPFLQADGDVAMHDLVSLAVRIETLVVTSHNQEVRPPRIVALALAAYLESLAATLPSAPGVGAPDAALRGADLFTAHCSTCHAAPSFSGPSVPLDVIGTDRTVGESLVRGTGTYRVPSLHGVSTRGPLLHDASLPDLASLLEPSRLDAAYTGGRLGPGPVPGHVFGLDLAAADRADLLAYLETL